MELTKLAGDCRSDDCPAVFRTDTGNIAIQGAIIERQTPDGEAIVEISPSLLKEAVRALGW
ncbi:hypothetical protein GCM10010174_43330 [Kutzneria viridogrisea]|uniref:DUF397 domain-containing protein n=1 Tax=Kutzneria viridogrisea TaxID=47990 RepID=A0ABR6BPW9_9PSEU|nr:hypothetical protein [Kutzneria viridogrisea]